MHTILIISLEPSRTKDRSSKIRKISDVFERRARCLLRRRRTTTCSVVDYIL